MGAEVIFPTDSDLIDMALIGLEDELNYLKQRMPKMSEAQRQALIRICSSISSMEEREAA